MNSEFLVASLIVVLMPGTGVLYTLTVALNEGGRQSAIAALGCTLGILPHLALVVAAISVGALTHPNVFLVMQVAGAVYLFWIAIALLRSEPSAGISKLDGNPSTFFRLVVDGVLVNLLNPKLTIFLLAFLPQFLDVGGPDPFAMMMILGAEFMAVTFAVFLLYGAGAALARDYVLSRPLTMVWINRSFGAAFLLLGLQLATTHLNARI